MIRRSESHHRSASRTGADGVPTPDRDALPTVGAVGPASAAETAGPPSRRDRSRRRAEAEGRAEHARGLLQGTLKSHIARLAQLRRADVLPGTTIPLQQAPP